MVPPHQTPEYHSVKHTAVLTWVRITNIKITACYWYYKTPLHNVNILYSRAQNTVVTHLSAYYMSKLGQRFTTGYSESVLWGVPHVVGDQNFCLLPGTTNSKLHVLR
jgi:hypothetical protein